MLVIAAEPFVVHFDIGNVVATILVAPVNNDSEQVVHDFWLGIVRRTAWRLLWNSCHLAPEEKAYMIRYDNENKTSHKSAPADVPVRKMRSHVEPTSREANKIFNLFAKSCIKTFQVNAQHTRQLRKGVLFLCWSLLST